MDELTLDPPVAETRDALDNKSSNTPAYVDLQPTVERDTPAEWIAQSADSSEGIEVDPYQKFILIINQSGLDQIMDLVLPKKFSNDFGVNDFSKDDSVDECVGGDENVAKCKSEGCISSSGVCSDSCWAAGLCKYVVGLSDLLGGKSTQSGYLDVDLITGLYTVDFSDSQLDLSMGGTYSFDGQWGPDLSLSTQLLIRASPIFKTTAAYIMNGDQGANAVDFKGTVDVNEIDVKDLSVKLSNAELKITETTSFEAAIKSGVTTDHLDVDGIGYTTLQTMANVFLGLFGIVGALDCNSLQTCMDEYLYQIGERYLNSDEFRETTLSEALQGALEAVAIPSTSTDSDPRIQFTPSFTSARTSILGNKSSYSYIAEIAADIANSDGVQEDECASGLSYSQTEGTVTETEFKSTGDLSLIVPLWAIEKTLYLAG
ncbi:MAG: hypothetical protein AAB425_04445, partial [Bdellovibrionota bacterium]